MTRPPHQNGSPMTTLDPIGLLAGMAPRPFAEYLSWLIDRLWGSNAALIRYWHGMGIDVDASVLSKWARGERRPHEANVLQIEQAIRHLYRARGLPEQWEELAVEQLRRSWRQTKPVREAPPDARILRELDRFTASYAPAEQDIVTDQFYALVRLAEHFYRVGYRAGYQAAQDESDPSTP